MPSARTTRILRSKTQLNQNEIEALTEAEAWEAIYAASPPKKPTDTRTKVTMTGFLGIEKDEKREILESLGFKVMASMAKSTEILIVGEEPGWRKIESAEERGVPIYEWDEFIAKSKGEMGTSPISSSEPSSSDKKEENTERASVAMIGFSQVAFDIMMKSLDIEFSDEITKNTNIVLLGENGNMEDMQEAIAQALPVMSLPILVIQASHNQEISTEFLDRHIYRTDEALSAIEKIIGEDHLRTKLLLTEMGKVHGITLNEKYEAPRSSDVPTSYAPSNPRVISQTCSEAKKTIPEPSRPTSRRRIINYVSVAVIVACLIIFLAVQI